MTTYLFKIITLLGGLALFLFGMDVMGKALERQAGGKLQTILSKMSGRVWKGFLLGAAVTAVIQSSSATTVMVVGFVNSGIMTLKQAVGVIMGSNVGTTVTAWILSLSGLEGDNFLIKFFKPSTLAPLSGIIGIILYMGKSEKRKGIGTIMQSSYRTDMLISRWNQAPGPRAEACIWPLPSCKAVLPSPHHRIS